MYKDLKFPVLIVHRDIKADTVAGDRIRGIARELEQEGFSIVSATDYTEGRLARARAMLKLELLKLQIDRSGICA